jgi:hypothetical protein
MLVLPVRNPRPAAVGIERAGARARDLVTVVGDAARDALPSSIARPLSIACKPPKTIPGTWKRHTKSTSAT